MAMGKGKGRVGHSNSRAQMVAARAGARRYTAMEAIKCTCPECRALRPGIVPRTLPERIARANREIAARHKARGLTPIAEEGQFE